MGLSIVFVIWRTVIKKETRVILVHFFLNDIEDDFVVGYLLAFLLSKVNNIHKCVPAKLASVSMSLHIVSS